MQRTQSRYRQGREDFASTPSKRGVVGQVVGPLPVPEPDPKTLLSFQNRGLSDIRWSGTFVVSPPKPPWNRSSMRLA